MTRINCGIDPKTLHKKHLLAEHREIVRIPNSIKSGKSKVKDIPEKFKLGTGHVKFFFNKLQYLHKRYIELYNECLKRNYNVKDMSDAFNDIPLIFYNDYKPTIEDIEIVTERINERLIEMQLKQQQKQIK